MVSLSLRRCRAATRRSLHQLRCLVAVQEQQRIGRPLAHTVGAALGQVGEVEVEVGIDVYLGRVGAARAICERAFGQAEHAQVAQHRQHAQQVAILLCQVAQKVEGWGSGG